MLDENLTWKNHINEIENKASKGIGLLYKTNFLLNRKCLKDIYYAFIHSYLNYANICWASTNPSKLKKLHNKQKHAARIILNKDQIDTFKTSNEGIEYPERIPIEHLSNTQFYV